MACYVNKVVATAISEIGYEESGNNITKYAAYFDKNYPNFYNTKKQGAEYCDIFVDYCVMVNSADENEAEYVLCQPAKSCGAGCSFSYDYYKEKGRVGNEPKIGAQIFFGTGKKPSHTGIVVDVTADKVITVEGNSDNMVKKHTYTKNSARIFGYGYPRYSEDTPTPAPAPTQLTDAEVDAIARDVIEGKYGNNPDRKKKLVSEYGEEGYTRIQNRVNEILAGNKTPSAKPSESPYTIYKCYARHGLYVRSGRGTGYSKLAILHYKEEVKVYDVESGWAKVDNDRVPEGYCAFKYLKKC